MVYGSSRSKRELKVRSTIAKFKVNKPLKIDLSQHKNILEMLNYDKLKHKMKSKYIVRI